MTGRKSFAFALIDGVVVAMLLGMLASLSLPAILQQEESARKTMCRNNLKQLGLAMHEYHAKHRTFPPGIIGQNFGPTDAGKCQFTAASETCDNPAFARASAFTLILPFMEQRGVHQAYNMQLACCAAENATATSVVVNTFVCPSNPRGTNLVSLPYYASKDGAAPTDYVLSMGGVGLFTCDNPFVINTSGPSKHGIPGIMKRAAGMFNVNSSISIDKMRDGTSNTIMIGESVGGPRLFVGRAATSLVEGGQRMDSASSKVAADNPWSMGYIGSGRDGIGQGFGSVFGATAWNAWYDSQGKLSDSAGWVSYPINEGKLKFNRPTWAQSSRSQTNLTGTDGSALPSSLGSVQGFRSYHSGAANVLLGDGSARGLTEGTDAKVLVGLSSIVGRESIDAAD